MRKLKHISIIIPCYNEEEVLEKTHERLSSIMKTILQNSKCSDYEILYVNDGSKDGTQKILDGIFARDSHARVLVCAGISVCRGPFRGIGFCERGRGRDH